MMQASNNAKRVLVFNPYKKLINISQSAFAIAKANNWDVAGIRSACNGKTVSYKKLYFRYLDDSVEVGLCDLGVLDLKEYDALCEVERKVYPTPTMTRKDMEYNKKPKEKSPFYPFKTNPQNAES